MKALIKVASKREALEAHSELLRRKGHWTSKPGSAAAVYGGAAVTGGAIGHVAGGGEGRKVPKHIKKKIRKGSAKLTGVMGLAAGGGAALGTHMRNKRTEKKFKGHSDAELHDMAAKHPGLTGVYKK